VMLLDLKRSNQINIALAKFHKQVGVTPTLTLTLALTLTLTLTLALALTLTLTRAPTWARRWWPRC